MSAAPLCLSAGRYPPHRIWTGKYPQIAGAVSSLPARQAYLDGELCGVRPDGITSFSMIQLASDAGNAAGPRVLSVRSSASRRRGSHRPAIDRAQDPACRIAGTSELIAALQRRPDRPWPGFLRESLRSVG